MRMKGGVGGNMNEEREGEEDKGEDKGRGGEGNRERLHTCI